jgi:ribosomal protein L16 Arg81 hydroxylase
MLSISSFLSPLSKAEFVESYLGRRAVYLPGDPKRIEGLMSRDSFFDLVDHPKADVFIGNVDADGRFHQFTIENRRARSMFACGFSLQVEELHLLDPQLMDLANTFREELGIFPAMEAAALLSPPSKGYPVHIDSNPDVWIIQVLGKKRWRFSKEPAVQSPLSWAMATKEKAWGGDPWAQLDKPDESEFADHVLTPGDVLYFPGGTWHTTEASEESLSIIVASVNSTWPDFFFDQLRDGLLARPDWRHVPAASANDMRAVLMSRLAELQEVVAGLDPDALVDALDSGRKRRVKGAYRQHER